MKRQLLLSLLSLAFSISALGQLKGEVQKALNKVDPLAIKATMSFLSDDLLEGRSPGTRGFAVASRYMESQFISIGLMPGIGDSSFIQKVPLTKGYADVTESGFSLIGENNKEEKLTYGKEFVFEANFANSESKTDAELVFVGYGISAAELNYDDYSGVDVKGKIVVFFRGAPKTLPSSERAYYSTAEVKFSEAIKRGAVGIIAVVSQTSWENLMKSNDWYDWLSPDGTAPHANGAIKAVARYNIQHVEKLFKNAPMTARQIDVLFQEGKSKSFPLNISATIKVKTVRNNIESSNLIGVIKGSDPVLKNEYIVYSAHLDHIGITTAVKGDSINNGAHDDASGNGILIEIARAYKALNGPPKRSVVFAVVTGEEVGLLGSDYFVNNLPFQNGKVVANLAIDMPFIFHPVLDIVPYGAIHSSLGRQTERAAKDLGLKISPDPFPEQVIFIRSDHYSFVQKGIPALFIKSGFMTVPTDTVDRAKSDVAWRSTHYHTVRDDMNQPFDFNAAATHVKINFLIGYYVSNDPTAPDWNKGDFFGRKFKRKTD